MNKENKITKYANVVLGTLFLGGIIFISVVSFVCQLVETRKGADLLGVASDISIEKLKLEIPIFTGDSDGLSNDDILKEKDKLLLIIKKDEPLATGIQELKQKGGYVNIEVVLQNKEVRTMAYPFETLLESVPELKVKLSDNDKKAEEEKEKAEEKKEKANEEIARLENEKKNIEKSKAKWHKFNFLARMIKI